MELNKHEKVQVLCMRIMDLLRESGDGFLGGTALLKILITTTSCTKEEFMHDIETAWDFYHADEPNKEKA